MTADGTVRTVFISPTSGPQDPNTGSQTEDSSVNHSGPATGTIVGIVVGVIGAVVLAAGAFFCFYLVRRKKRQETREDLPSQRGSSSGMMATPRTEMGEAGPATWGASGDGSELGKRQSKLMPVDPRMDPFNVGIYARKSQESINTLRDDHDYSRKVHQPKVLRATNPDPHMDD